MGIKTDIQAKKHTVEGLIDAIINYFKNRLIQKIPIIKIKIVQVIYKHS